MDIRSAIRYFLNETNIMSKDGICYNYSKSTVTLRTREFHVNFKKNIVNNIFTWDSFFLILISTYFYRNPSSQCNDVFYRTYLYIDFQKLITKVNLVNYSITIVWL